MYGLVNKAIKDLVVNNFGQDKWEAILAESKVGISEFEGLKPYDDAITYSLVGAASKVLALSAEDVLRAFGKYWILFTAQAGYGDLMDLFGNDFKSCIINLNQMHSRMGAMMPALTPPRFVAKKVGSNLEVEYHSKRNGLAPMVVGLFEGLAEKHNEKVKILQHPRGANDNCDKFTIEMAA